MLTNEQTKIIESSHINYDQLKRDVIQKFHDDENIFEIKINVWYSLYNQNYDLSKKYSHKTPPQRLLVTFKKSAEFSIDSNIEDILENFDLYINTTNIKYSPDTSLFTTKKAAKLNYLNSLIKNDKNRINYFKDIINELNTEISDTQTKIEKT